MAKRKIKIMEAVRFDYTIQSIQDEEISIVENPAFYREYDENENLIKEIIYGPGGYLSEKYAFVYQDGKMIEQIVYLDENTIAEHQYFEYQEDRIVKQITKYQEGEDETRWVYDDMGRIISKTTYDEGDESEKTIYKYENNLIRKQKFDEGELILEEFKEMDSEGHLIKFRSNNIVDEEEIITSYRYSASGNLEVETQTSPNGKLIQRIENQYNESGQQISMRTTDGHSSSLIEFKYDDNGNEIFQLETNEDGEINHKVDRKMDSEGNILETDVSIFYHGEGMDSRYHINYNYTFFEDEKD